MGGISQNLMSDHCNLYSLELDKWKTPLMHLCKKHT